MRSLGIRCMKYKLEYKSASLVLFAVSDVSTRILEKTSRFHSSRAACAVSSMDQEGSSLSLYEHALSTDINEMPTRDLMVRAFARQLLREHHGQSISLSRITHELPGTEPVLNGTPLDAPESYIEEPIGQFPWRDFSP